MSSEASERDLDALANAVAERLEPGSYGDKMLLNRRQLLALAGARGICWRAGDLGVTEAEAQEVVGQVGTDQERVDVYGGEGDFQSLSAESLQTTETRCGGVKRTASGWTSTQRPITQISPMP